MIIGISTLQIMKVRAPAGVAALTMSAAHRELHRTSTGIARAAGSRQTPKRAFGPASTSPH